MTSMDQIETGNFAIPHSALPRPDSIRAVNWNINRGLQLQGIVEFLASTNADLILLQEIDLNARRTHHVDIAREISQKLQMNYIFGREFQELTQGSRRSPAYHGQATLSRWPLTNSRIIRFERQSNFWRPRWFRPGIEPFQGRIGGRLALASDVNIAGRTIATYNLHLESKGDDALRYSQLEEALHDAGRYDWDTPILLAGDFNLDLSEGPAAASISRAQFQDALANQQVPTAPPHSLLNHGRLIDWMFARGPIRAGQPQVHRSISASDHYPLSITLSLTDVNESL
ncbi:MAG TPA: endonuclease/exonuclease/phosphatase family protein [Candidatus Acidoferrales bacterium]|nr:endonuclease/exonuclease/phosphatase family protein [Candidatus Acidoferrales bacterium]